MRVRERGAAVGASSLMPFSYLVDVRKSFYFVNPLSPVRPLCFADRVTEVTGRGVRPGEPVFLYGCLTVGIPPGTACTLAKGPLC